MPSKKQRSKSAKTKMPKSEATVLNCFKFITGSEHFIQSIGDKDYLPPWVTNQDFLPELRREGDGACAKFCDETNEQEIGAAALWMHYHTSKFTMEEEMDKMDSYDTSSWMLRVDSTANMFMRTSNLEDKIRPHTLFPFIFSQWDVCHQTGDQTHITCSATKYTGIDVVWNEDKTEVHFEVADKETPSGEAIGLKDIGGETLRTKKYTAEKDQEFWDEMGCSTCDDDEILQNYLLTAGAFQLMRSHLTEVESARTASWEIIYKWAIAFGIDFANYATTLALDETIAIMRYHYRSDFIKTPKEFDPKTGRGRYVEEVDEIDWEDRFYMNSKIWGIEPVYNSRLMEINPTTVFTRVMRMQLAKIDHMVFKGLGGGSDKRDESYEGFFVERGFSKKAAQTLSTQYQQYGHCIRKLYTESNELTRSLITNHIDPVLVGFRIAANERCKLPPIIPAFLNECGITPEIINMRCDKLEGLGETGTAKHLSDFIRRMYYEDKICPHLVPHNPKYYDISLGFDKIQSSFGGWIHLAKDLLENARRRDGSQPWAEHSKCDMHRSEAELICREVSQSKRVDDNGKAEYLYCMMSGFRPQTLADHIDPFVLKAAPEREAPRISEDLHYNLSMILMLSSWVGMSNPAYERGDVNIEKMEEWQHPMADRASEVVKKICDKTRLPPWCVFYTNY